MSGLAHFLHFILFLITGGFWLIPWIICALVVGSNRRKREHKEQMDMLQKIIDSKGEK